MEVKFLPEPLDPLADEGFSDANWIFDFDETKSTSDYVFTLADDAVS